MSNENKFYGWKLVAAVAAVYFLNMGIPLYGGAVLNTFLLKEIHMDRATYGLGFTLMNLFIGLSAVLAGTLINKWGIRATFITGSALIAGGTVWLSQVANQPWHYLVGFGVLIGSGMGLGTIVALSTTITRWFVKYRGRAMALAMIAASFAGFIGAPLVNKLVSLSGGNWRLVWLCITATTFLSACIAFLFVKERPQDLGQVPDGEIPDAAGKAASHPNALVTRYAWTPAEAFRTRTYWLTVVATAASQWPFFFFTAHWIMHLRGKGIGPAEAALAMGFFSLGGIMGRLIGGWLMDKMAARYVMMLGISVYFVGSFLAIQVIPGAFTVAYIAALCYGAAFGWAFVAQNTMLGHFFGPAAFPKVNGNLQAITALMVAASGVVGGKLFDMFKSYTPAFQLNAAICVVGIICLIFVTMPKAPDASTTAQ